MTTSSGKSCRVIPSSVSVQVQDTRDDPDRPIETLERISTGEYEGDYALDRSSGLYSACDFDLGLASGFEP